MQSVLSFFFEYGHWAFTPLHILVCLILIAVVLLQTGKGADWAGALGGGGTQTAFGPRGVENTLSKLTKYAAIIFMVTSLGLSVVKSKRSASTFRDLPSRSEVEAEAPAETAPPVESPVESAIDEAEPETSGATTDSTEAGGEPAPESSTDDGDGTAPEEGGEATPGN